ncbi:TetR/AcrR family transcriptional regulator [Nesterenkonia haasae]|uniref:TetR/AcrR family transcriptional regulator n=1 Tax=Nesterenkonia haasae TaxID=2587813 RepID=UPI001390ECCA|nr:TetR family transcriptional regulator [Nesterenkonia haasae]
MSGAHRERGPGRPPGANSGQTRQAIVDAARRQFAERGFRGASVRSIAAEAGVDASLINHHFGDKAGLLIATMKLPFDPLRRIDEVLDGSLEGLAARLIRTFCESWDPQREVFSTVVRSAMGGGLDDSPLFDLLKDVIIVRFADRLKGEGAPLRATLVGSQIVGLAVMRYVAQLEPLASADVDHVVAAYAPALQTIMTPLESS